MLLIRRRKSSRASDDRGSFESIISERAPHPHFPFSFPFFFPRPPCLCMSSWLPKAGTVHIPRLAATIAKYSRVTLENTRFSLAFEHPPPSFVIFLSSLLRSQPRYTRSLSFIPRCHEQVLYSGDASPFLAWFRFSKLCLFAVFRSIAPLCIPGPFPTTLPEPLESLLRLFTNYRTHFPSLYRLSLSLGSHSTISGENQLLPVCFVVNGSPRGRRSARYSRNKEILSSSLYSTLFALVRKGAITAITSASCQHFKVANAYGCIFRDHLL